MKITEELLTKVAIHLVLHYYVTEAVNYLKLLLVVLYFIQSLRYEEGVTHTKSISKLSTAGCHLA